MLGKPTILGNTHIPPRPRPQKKLASRHGIVAPVAAFQLPRHEDPWRLRGHSKHDQCHCQHLLPPGWVEVLKSWEFEKKVFEGCWDEVVVGDDDGDDEDDDDDDA